MSAAADEKIVKNMTNDDIQRFHHDGYLPWDRVVDDDLLDMARAAYDRIFSYGHERGLTRNLSRDGVYEPNHDADGQGRMLQIMNCYRLDPVFQRLIYHSPILDPIKALLGPNLALFHDQALYKPARDGREVFWHQDNGYWQVQPANLVSCWLTLDDVDADNGAMQFIPGSHRQAIAHHRSQQSNALMDIKDHIDTSSAVTVPLAAGCCVYHHCQTYHYTDVNKSDRDRRAFIIHAMVPGSRGRSGVLPIGYEHPLLCSAW